MRKSAEQISWEVLLKLAESPAMPPPPEDSAPMQQYSPSTPQYPPPQYFPAQDQSQRPPEVEMPQETAGPTLPSQEELEEMYRKAVMSRALVGTGIGAVAGGTAGGILTKGNPLGILGGAAGLGFVGNRIGASVGEHAALKKLEESTGVPWTMPGTVPEVK